MRYTFIRRVIIIILGMIIVIQGLDILFWDLGLKNPLFYIFWIVLAFEGGLFISNKFLQ